MTVAEDWRGVGLASTLLASLVRRALRDGYVMTEGTGCTEHKLDRSHDVARSALFDYN